MERNTLLLNDGQIIELFRWGISVSVPVLSGLAGVLIGALLTKRRERLQRKHDFVSRQLKDFYSPLLGIRSEIKMLGELRLKIHDVADTTWRQLCDEAREAGGPTALREMRENRFPEFKRIIEYDNRQLAEELLPAYRRMVTIFRENMWLAETETRFYFNNLLEFVELWNRWLAETVPSEVIRAIKHDEDSLQSFYKHLEEKHDELQAKLSRGNV
jgi:hypothetical protein